MDPVKAYENLPFLKSASARAIRLLCEYEEPRQRFDACSIRGTIVFFGSARVLPVETAREMRDLAKMELQAASGEHRASLESTLARAEQRLKMGRYYEDARKLARKLAQWSASRAHGPGYVICSGGGPGIMEAANRGAADVKGGRSIGLGISVPTEETVNQYVSPELAFEFHYFFMRKYWFLYHAKAQVIYPGGFGTLDELMETLTLRQTGKLGKDLPMVLYGAEYWNDILDLHALVKWGTISPADLDLLHISDTVDEAFQYIVDELAVREGKLRGVPSPGATSQNLDPAKDPS